MNDITYAQVQRVSVIQTVSDAELSQFGEPFETFIEHTMARHIASELLRKGLVRIERMAGAGTTMFIMSVDVVKVQS